MTFLHDILIFIITYVLTSYVIFLCLVKLSRENSDKNLLFIISLGVGPTFISLILYFLFLSFPGYSRLFYIFVVGAIYIVLLTIGIKGFYEIKEIHQNAVNSLNRFIKVLKKGSFNYVFMVAIITFFVLLILILGMNYPKDTYDAKAYAIESDIIYRDLNSEHYNPVKFDFQERELYRAGYSPGFPFLYTWLYLLKGTSDSDGLIRTVVPMYTFFLLVLLGYVLRKRTNYSCILGILLLVTIPAFFTQAYQNSQDPIRIYFVVLSLVILANLLHNEIIFHTLLLGLALGLAVFVHGLGLLVVPIVMFAYFLYSKRNFKKKILTMALIALISCCIGGWQYYLNFAKYGSIRGKSGNVEQPKISFEASQERNRELTPREKDITFNKYYFGYFQVFTNLKYFKIQFYIFLFSIFLWWKYFKSKTELDKVFITAFFSYIFLHILAIPYIDLWSSWRYIGTTVPIWAYFSGLVLSSGIDDKDKNPIRRFWPVFLIIILVIPAEL